MASGTLLSGPAPHDRATYSLTNPQLGVIASAICAAVFIVIMLLGIEIPIVIYAVDRQRAVSLLAQVRHWISTHARLLMNVVSLVLGTYLTGRGIVGLLA
jgi:hypothetical protein